MWLENKPLCVRYHGVASKDTAEQRCTERQAQLIETNSERFIRSVIREYRTRLIIGKFFIRHDDTIKWVAPDKTTTDYELHVQAGDNKGDVLCAKVPIYPIRMASNTRNSVLYSTLYDTRDSVYHLLIGDKKKQLRYMGDLYGKDTDRCRDERIILPENLDENEVYKDLALTRNRDLWLGAIKESDKYVNRNDGGSDLNYNNWAVPQPTGHMTIINHDSGVWHTTEDGTKEDERKSKVATANLLYCEDDILSK